MKETIELSTVDVPIGESDGADVFDNLFSPCRLFQARHRLVSLGQV
jgi:hypothetical protein